VRFCAALLGASLLNGCGRREAPPPVGPPEGVVAAELSLQVSDSVAVWFTRARADTSADGTPCRERVMEIRSGQRTVPVPLLYTGESPIIATDSTIHVHIWRHCVPADLYRVHLRTGQPTRVGS
jgi:hypothetical protein